MRISVIVPCYNAEAHLAQALGSALEQTRPPDEIIVVDDGSTDASQAIAMRFAHAVPDRVRVILGLSRHAGRARNLGALSATGDALMFLDADDVLGADAIEGLASALQRQPHAFAACPWFRLTEVGGRWVSGPASSAPRRPGTHPLDAWLLGWYHPPCSMLWSREAFEQAGRFDEQAPINQDGDLVMRALARGVCLVESETGIAYYRRHGAPGASISGSRLTRTGLAGRIRVIRKVAAALEEQGTVDAHRAALAAAFVAIATDAAGRQQDLADLASRLARRYRPALPTRLVSRWRALRAPSEPRRASAHRASEVTDGQLRAQRVLADAPSALAMVPASVPRPEVTVIIPAYNRAHVLPRTLSSVLSQTFQDFEVLLVDDGSTDDTRQVVAAVGDRRIRYLRQPHNGGVAAARNRGMREARGEFIAFLDSDDEWLPQKLERQVACLLAAPETTGLVYTGVETVRDDGPPTVARAGARGDIYREMLHHNVIHGGGSNVVIRRAVIATAGFFHEDLPAIEDYEYWLRITRFFDVDAIDEPLVRYHDRGSAERRSRALRANLEARGWLFRRYARDMRRARVAHLFLLRDVRRALRAPAPDYRTARRLALRALLEAPLSRMALASFIGTSVQGASQWRWIRRHAALG